MKDNNVIKSFLNNEKWKKKAKEYTSLDKFAKLVEKATEKMNSKKESFSEGVKYLKMYIMMIYDYFRNDFKLTKKELSLIIAGIVYFVSPLDAVPDFIPVAGMIDDITVLSFVSKQLSGLIDSYDLRNSDFIDVEFKETEGEE
ncbi:DUF1232 domain-containing protein [Mycoplasmatota bacterium]|nr:DUF1232 domain-containing protein [Mycoplasmatota bacterium]